MKKWWMKGLSLLGISALLLTGCGGGEEATQQQDMDQAGAEKKEVTITIGETPWTSTIPPTYIAKQLLDEMGYKVEIQKADIGVVFTGLSTGDVDVFMDSWLPDMHKNYMEKYGDKVDDTAISYPDGDLGLVVPTYMEDINSVKDLKGKEGLFEGKMYGIEEGAGSTKTAREMFEALGLEIEHVSSSEAGMLAQAKKLIQAKKPVVFLGWRPHPMFIDFDLKFLKDQEEFYKRSEVHVLTHKGLKEKAPEAYAFLSKWSIPVGDIEAMIVKIDQGAKPEEVAKEWIDNNQDKVKSMLAK